MSDEESKSKILVGVLNFESGSEHNPKSEKSELPFSYISYPIPYESDVHNCIIDYMGSVQTEETVSKEKYKHKRGVKSKHFTQLENICKEYKQKRAPTIFKHGTYFAFTKHQEERKPSLCIQEMSGLADETYFDDNQNISAKMMEIPGVEFLLGVDGEDHIYFLSNDALFDQDNMEAQSII